MIKMAGVVADFIDVRGDFFGESIILLQVDREIGGCLLANLSQGSRVLIAVDGDSNDAGTGLLKKIDESHRRVDIGGVGRRHTLNGDRVIGSDMNGADADTSSWVAIDRHICIVAEQQKLVTERPALRSVFFRFAASRRDRLGGSAS